RPGSRRRHPRARHQSLGDPAPRRGGTRRIGGEAVSEAAGETANGSEELLTRLENGVLWLTINRADKGNAIPYFVRDALIEQFRDAPPNLNVRAVVLTATGERHFCTGADLSISPPIKGGDKPDGAPDRVTGTAINMM